MTNSHGRSGSTPDSSDHSRAPRILAFSRSEQRGVEPVVSLHAILADLTTGIAADGRRPRVTPVSVTLDVADAPQVEADGEVLRRLLAPLLDRSVAAAAGRSEPGTGLREVLVTAVGYPDRVEIEFADSGPGLTPRERNSLPRGRSNSAPRESTDPLLDDVLRLAVSIGGTVSAMECPEGGSAVTLSLPIRRAALRRAA